MKLGCGAAGRHGGKERHRIFGLMQSQSFKMVAAFGLLLLARPGEAQSTAVISGDRIRAGMQVLASDSFGGRKPGTPSERLTTSFIVSQMKAAGLQPAARGWLQPVELETRYERGATLSVDGPKAHQVDSVAVVGRTGDVKLAGVPLAWGGYATSRASGAARSVLAGAVVLYRDSDAPGSAQPRPTDGLTRIAALAKAGAAGAIAVIPDDQYAHRKAIFTGGVTTIKSDPQFEVRGIISESAARRMLEATGMTLADLDAKSAEPGFDGITIPVKVDVQVTTAITSFTSHNVAGMLFGAKEPDQYVMYTAHWDSFGQCSLGQADSTCNGAIDNASGTAGLLELARAFTSGPHPDRSIIFLATTAEEMGLAGSRQYTRTPLVPLSRTVAEFNLDVIVLYDRGNTAGFVGAGLTSADSTFERLVGEQGRKLDTGAMTRMVLRSSDAWSLLMAGVPSFILSGAIGSGAEGNKAFMKYLSTRYHQPADEYLADMPMGGAVEEVELLYAAGMWAAKAGTMIRFLPGSAFMR